MMEVLFAGIILLFMKNSMAQLYLKYHKGKMELKLNLRIKYELLNF